jgi:hypothetical protein
LCIFRKLYLSSLPKKKKKQKKGLEKQKRPVFYPSPKVVWSRESQAPYRHDKNKGSDHPMQDPYLGWDFIFLQHQMIGQCSRYPGAASITTRYVYIPVLWVYPVWTAKTSGSGSGSCNSSWHHLVRTGTRTRPSTKCFARCRIGIIKKYFKKRVSIYIYVKKSTFFKN